MSGNSVRCWAVIPAAGAGQRMGTSQPKQYLPLAGRTVIEHALAPLLTHPAVAGVVVALDPDDTHWSSLDLHPEEKIMTVAGGAERADSVLNALRSLAEHAAGKDDWVLVHDAVRPCLAREDLDRLFEALIDDPVGGILAAPVNDTLKLSGANAVIHTTVDRRGLWRAFTPQMFRLQDLCEAIEYALDENLWITDEAAAIEHAGLHPRLVEGRGDNIKITRPDDLILAEQILAARISDRC